jgi:uncharacterized protein YigE (DUF2233 family)
MSPSRLLAILLALGLAGLAWQARTAENSSAAEDARFVSYRVDPRRQRLALYWQDAAGRPLRSLQGLKTYLAGRGQRLLAAMNGGMYRAGNVPLGLFIEAGRVRTPLDTGSGPGNFYLKPNGVFYLTADGRAAVCRTSDFRLSPRIRYATQSGPMLLIDGRIHPAFRPGSANVQIRNGVGILPDGRVLLALSRQPVSFYDFARYFQRQGCRQALYLDGFVSRAYLPDQHWEQTDGDFGVIIGVVNP